MNKKGWLVFMICIVIGVILFNLKFLGFAVSNDTFSEVTIIAANYPPEIWGINDTLYVCEDESFSHFFYANDSDSDDLSQPGVNYWIIPQDPFFVFWVTQTVPNTHKFVIISGALRKKQFAGVNYAFKLYEETIYVDDDYNSTCCEDSKEINITLIEINHAPIIENIGVQTVWTQGENSSFYEVVDVEDLEYDDWGYGNLTFNLSIVNSSGSEVNLFNISQGGVIDFTADNYTPIGVYDITICVRDIGLTSPHERIDKECGQTGGALFDCDEFSLTVTNENRAPNITAYYPLDLSFNNPGTQRLYFNITKNDPDGTIPDAYWYINDVLIEIDSGSSVDEFTKTFGCGVAGDYTIKVDITDGKLNDSLQWNVTITRVDCVSPTPSSSGGGGGGIVTLREFVVKPEFVTTTIFLQEGKSFDIEVSNTGGRALTLNLSFENLTDMAILNENTFTLLQGESKTVNLYLYALSKTEPGIYFGKLVVSDGFSEKYVSIVLEIKEKSALFDFKVAVPLKYKSVYPGENVNVIADILNVGLYGTAVDVEVYLYIMDFDKLVLYETSKEVIAVETNLSFERTLHVPLGAVAGPYLVLGEMKYINITIETFDTFNVFERKYLKTSYTLVIIIVIALILFILFLIYKRRKDRKERGYK